MLVSTSNPKASQLATYIHVSAYSIPWKAIFVLYLYNNLNIWIYTINTSAETSFMRPYKCAPSEILCPHARLNPN